MELYTGNPYQCAEIHRGVNCSQIRFEQFPLHPLATIFQLKTDSRKELEGNVSTRSDNLC